MKVFELRFARDYQQLALVEEPTAPPQLTFNGRPKGESWPKPLMYVPNPSLKVPDFWYVGNPAAFAFDPDALPLDASGHVELAGEWLPIDVEKPANLMILNVTQVVNALDKQRTRWRTDSAGARRPADENPGSYVFHPERFDESSICKLPETRDSMILCVESSHHRFEEFKAAIEYHRLKGLEFKLLWEG